MNKTWKEQIAELSKKLNQATQIEPKESDMDNVNKVVETVKEKVNTVINTGKQAAISPRVIGEKLAKTVNGVHDKKEQVKDAFKLGFTMLKQGYVDIKEGYKDTRYKKPVVHKAPDKSNI